MKKNIDKINKFLKDNKKIFKISKLKEALNLIKSIHTQNNHRNYTNNLDILKDKKIYWKGMYNNIIYYIKNCSQYQCKNNTIFKRPVIKQLLFNNPKDRYIIDITDTPYIINHNTNYKYILHILDHYRKYLFWKLLLNKKAATVINSLEEIFLLTGFPKEIGGDNEKEFSNLRFKKF